MATAISRRQFLRGDLSGQRALLRPPWAVAETEFQTRCTACGECVTRCPQHILVRDSGGFPHVDFARGECDFCAECVSACAPGALRETHAQPWSLKAYIDHSACLAGRAVECRRCSDPCPVGAIRVRPRIGGFSVPEISLEQCSGCGACFSVCPVQAISMRNSEESA